MSVSSRPPRYRNQVPNLKQLFEELGCNATTQRRLQESAHHWRRNYVCEDGQEGKDLTNWRSKATLNMLNHMARDFLESDQNGIKFWPSSGKGCIGNGLRYPEDLQKICSLMQQVFWRQNEYEMRNARHPDRHHAFGKTRPRSEDMSSISSAEENIEGHGDRVGSAGPHAMTPSLNPYTEVAPTISDRNLHVPELNSREQHDSHYVSANVNKSHNDGDIPLRNARATEGFDIVSHSTLSPSSSRRSGSDGEGEILGQSQAKQRPLASLTSQEALNTTSSTRADCTIDDDMSKPSQLEEMTAPVTKPRRGRQLTHDDDGNAVPRKSRRSRSSSWTPMSSTRQSHQCEYGNGASKGARHSMNALAPSASRKAWQAVVQNPILPVSESPEHLTEAGPCSEPFAHLSADQEKRGLSTKSPERPESITPSANGIQESPGSQSLQTQKHHDMLRRSRMVDPHIHGEQSDERAFNGPFTLAVSDFHDVTSARSETETATTQRENTRRAMKDDCKPAIKKVQIRYTIIKSRIPTLIKQNWRTNGLSGKTFEELCEEIAQIMGQRRVHRVHFQLLLQEVRFDYVVDRDEPEEFDEMRDIFTEEIKQDMRLNNNMRFEISLEPDPIAQGLQDSASAYKDNHHDMDFTI